MRVPQPESKEDLVQAVPEGVPAWSENIFFFPFDYEKQIGIFSHLGRSFQDPHLWREYVHVLLPGGRALLTKSFGRRPDESETVTGGNGLRYEVVEPFRRWHLSFDGVARDTTRAALMTGANRDGRGVHLQFDLEAEFLCAPWSAATATPEDGGLAGGAKQHFEQVSRYTGTITVDGEVTELDARGFRDHSRGPRKFEARSGHTLLSGAFPSGLMVGMFETRALDGTPKFSQGFTVRDGVPYDAEVVRVPTYQRDDVPEPWTVVLRDDRGEELVVEGQPIDSVPMSIQAPNDLIQGLSGLGDEHHCVLTPSRLTCRGEQGTGHLELSRYNGG
jgi:hypothetical protein